MRLLIDACLSFRIAEARQKAGHHAVHVKDVLTVDAPNSTIFDHAAHVDRIADRSLPVNERAAPFERRWARTMTGIAVALAVRGQSRLLEQSGLTARANLRDLPHRVPPHADTLYKRHP